MENKRDYKSFKDINLDLQIYKTEKEIAYAKIIRKVGQTKEDVKQAMQPLNLIKSIFVNAFKFFETQNKSLKTILFTYGIKFLIRKFTKD